MARKQKSGPGPYLRHLELQRDRITNPQVYPYNLPAFRNLDTLAFHPKVTFLVGENGSGKSTLLEAIAIEYGLNPEGGSRNLRFSTRGTHSSLADVLRLVKMPGMPRDSYFLRAESFYNVASALEQLDEGVTIGKPIRDAYGPVPLHEQSHGESFFALFERRFGDHGLYLMDEPEAALSPQRQLQFLGLLHDLIRRGSQFVIATHSPIILAYPEACLYHLDAEGIRPMAYTDTEHYRVTSSFLSNPRRYLSILLADDSEGEET